MEMEYTEEQLNKFDKAAIVQLFLAQQSQLKDIDNKLQLVLEQLAVMNNHRFGKSSEKLDTDNQIAFLEVEGEIVFFNEAEAVASITEYDEEDAVKPRSKKVKGKRAEDLKDLPIVSVSHMMSEQELLPSLVKTAGINLRMKSTIDTSSHRQRLKLKNIM